MDGPGAGSSEVPLLTSEQRWRRAKIAARTRHSPTDPNIDDDRRALKASRLEDHVRQIVDSFPPLTEEQRNRIAALLRPSSHGGGDVE